MAVKDWSTTAADNDDADSTINWLEGQAPSTVNDSARAMMAALKSWYNLIDAGTISNGTVGGTANAITLTCSPTVSALAAGQRYLFKYTSTGNTGGVTLNVDGLGAAAIQFKGAALVSGDIATNDWVLVTHDGSVFQMLSETRVSSRAVLDGSVTTGKIVDLNVTEAKIGTGAVTATKIGSDAVTTIKILDGNVTTGKIANLAVTPDKLSQKLTVAAPVDVTGLALITFSSIPSWARKITISFINVTVASGNVYVRVGNSSTGVVTASNYTWGSTSITGAYPRSRFEITSPALNADLFGHMILTYHSSAFWVASMTMYVPNVGPHELIGAGAVDISAGDLDRIEIGTVAGGNFGDGAVSLIYE